MDVSDTVTEIEPKLALALSRKRRPVSLEWVDQAGPHQVALEGRVLAGSNEKAAVHIADPRVSRLHAELEPTDDGVFVRDLVSRNGTWIDQIRVERVRVQTDTVLRLGPVSF